MILHKSYDTANSVLENFGNTTVFCAGKNCFLDNNGTTIIETKGELRIDPDKIEGLPQPFRGQIASTVENFLEKNIGPNLRQMSEGVHNYLEQTTKNRS